MKEAKMRELIYLARCGEGEAYEALYHLYLRLAVKISYELLANYHTISFDIPELAHCADERFTRVIKSYDERFYSSPASYFYLCIKRSLMRALEQEKAILTVSLDEPIGERNQLADLVADPTPQYNPIEQQNKQIRYEILKRDLALVDSPRDAVIFRYYWEGYTVNEIAAILNIARTGSIYNVIARTIHRLRRRHQGQNGSV